MDRCCQTAYDNTFDLKMARKEMADYLKSGPKRSTQYLLDAFKNIDLEQQNMLDIGGGIGAIIWEFKAQGVGQVYYQDISHGYAQIFEEQVRAKGWSHSIDIQTGDFVEHRNAFPAADVVTLDKVICCYEDFRTLVSTSVVKAQKYYAYTLPVDVWWVKAVSTLGSFFRGLTGNKVRTYVHSTAEVETMVLARGFQKIYQKQHREWLTVVFQKVT